MSPDPFDHLRDLNPMPEDRPVYAPMSAADRITGRAPRRARPVWALAGGLALAALLAGGGWLLWIRGGSQEIAATSSPGTTQVPPTTGVPVDVPPTGEVVVYFFVEDDGTQSGTGPYLIPVGRSLAILSHMVTDPVAETLNFLLVGVYPGEEQAGPALLSAIPEGTQLLGVNVADGIANVDLSAEFASDVDLLRHAVAQIVFTLTRFPEIRAVHFLVEGEPLLTPVRTGIPDPATRADFDDLLPAVMIESPAHWSQPGPSPMLVSGTANVFEAVVSLELLDQDGAVLWEGTTMATCGTGCRGDFSVEVPYEVGESQLGTLVAWEVSMRDGSRTNVRQHPVWLEGSGEGSTTTDPVAALLAERYDLDKSVDDLLAQIEAIDAQLAGLGPEEGADLRTQAAQLDRQVAEQRDRLSALYDGLVAAGAEFAVPCSAEGLGSELVGQPALPTEAATLRTAIYEAARACDWAALAGLLDPTTFSYSFGDSGDPIAYWQRAEFLHYEPMLYVAGMLQRPFGVVSNGAPIYVWPSAQAYASWAEVPQTERDALRPLYGDLDFGFFEEFGGYLGYRVGITLEDGGAHWLYAIAGD